MIKKFRKFITNSLGINIYNIGGVWGYNRVYENRLMDVLEYVYDKLLVVYKFISKKVYSLILYSSALFFMLIPSGGQLAPLERAKLLVNGIRRERNGLLEEYQAQFQEVYDNADDASVINHELMAMDDEQRVAFFRQQDQDIQIMYATQDKERDDFMNRYFVNYKEDKFKICFKRSGYFDNYRVKDVKQAEVDGVLVYTVMFVKSNKPSDILKSIQKHLSKKHLKVTAKIDESILLEIPKLEFAITEYIEYKGIPDRQKERTMSLDDKYATMIQMSEMFALAQQEQKAEKDKELQELVDKYSKTP